MEVQFSAHMLGSPLCHDEVEGRSTQRVGYLREEHYHSRQLQVGGENDSAHRRAGDEYTSV